jgi:hypothetical protein
MTMFKFAKPLFIQLTLDDTATVTVNANHIEVLQKVPACHPPLTYVRTAHDSYIVREALGQILDLIEAEAERAYE